ncbi:carbohydrate ABC transporter permease [Sphaerochaeta sp. S2]|uniref:carbohydrate ABC transporter permease n=1 Tax=Sphaerochaeta sp. S2 TaxID=2798868 RepID=UPI0018E95ACA|nr:sugar ABC transporter permease [Sphaerochaeta sp. S2]MBJ2357754.1 sugar ABC transporter permease [Sphaerochaeta sp. S2]
MKHRSLRSATATNTFFWGWALILPTVIGLLVLNIIPMIATIYQSFHKTGDFGRGNIFIGFKNFQKLFSDEAVLQSIINTLKYTIAQVPFSVFIALVLAVMLNRKIIGRSVYRTIYFMPMVVAPAAIAMVWRWLYNSEFGLINNLFNLDINWISNPSIAVFSIAIIGIWSDIGYNMILFLAGLQEVPKDYYEAADLDGASAVQSFLHITVPMISPILFFVIVTRMIAAMQVFDTIFMVMERSNPALYKTQSLVFLFYESSFVERDLGYGSTIVVVLLLIIMLITALQMIAQRKWVHYN